MSEYQDFTSLPRNEEVQFTVFERRTVEDSKKALTLGMIVAGIVGLFVIIVVLSFDPPKNQHAEDLMEAELAAEEDSADTKNKSPSAAGERKSDTEEAAAPEGEDAEGAEAGAEGAEAAEGAEGAEAGAEAAPAEAPPPPKGATKAPPTALTGQ